MKCSVCGGKMKSIKTDLPFKTGDTSIIIIKGLPVLQCESCADFLLNDEVMEQIEELFSKVDTAAELEVVRYAA